MALRYRSPLVRGGSFAEWLDMAKGASGVYVFRNAWSKRVQYVGESHSGRLYKTITRHFWEWTDDTSRPHYVVGVSPVELAIVVMPAGRAVNEQNELIYRLRPKHNRTNPIANEVPF